MLTRQNEQTPVSIRTTPIFELLSRTAMLERNIGIAGVSVTPWYWLKTNDRTFTQFPSPGSPGTRF